MDAKQKKLFDEYKSKEKILISGVEDYLKMLSHSSR
jgi:hypothetical protein